MDYYVNIGSGGKGKSGTIHWRECTWAKPTVKGSRHVFWFGTVTLDAARRIVSTLGAEENIHTFCIDRETLQPRERRGAT